jgi:hypothetical protein
VVALFRVSATTILSLFNVTTDLGALRFVAAKGIDENERGYMGLVTFRTDILSDAAT